MEMCCSMEISLLRARLFDDVEGELPGALFGVPCSQACKEAVDPVDDEGDGEGHGDDVEERVDLPELSPRHLDQGVGDETEADAVGDAVGEGDADDGQEGGEGLLEVAEGDLPHDGHHEEADHDEGPRGDRVEVEVARRRRGWRG
jgi:hypothetical protein